MREIELRAQVAAIAKSLTGGRGEPSHLRVLDTYNNYRPLARGYQVQKRDPYCATAVSAIWILAGCAPYTGTECSCGELVQLAIRRGIWIEADDYRPQIADAIVYDWGDSGKGENKGSPDHIGLVVDVSGDKLTVREGNMSGGKFGERKLEVNGRYIRGYICPDYRAIAAAMTASSWAQPAAYECCHRGLILGDETGRVDWSRAITMEQLAVVLARWK